MTLYPSRIQPVLSSEIPRGARNSKGLRQACSFRAEAEESQRGQLRRLCYNHLRGDNSAPEHGVICNTAWVLP